MSKISMLKLTLIISSFGLILLSVACNTNSTSPSTLTQNQQSVDVISIKQVEPPIPAGPTVEIILKNVGNLPIFSLIAHLELERTYEFDFDVADSNPLLPGETISKTMTLIGPGSGISSNSFYSLTINATLQNTSTITYTRQVKIQ